MARRLAFVVAALLALSVLLEGGAWIAEALLAHGPRSLPTPDPSHDPAMIQKMAAANDGVPMQHDENRQWAMTPGIRLVNRFGLVMRINRLGMRGPAVTPRAVGEERLLSLGDSTAFGVNVAEQQVYSSVAAQKLAKHLGRPVSSMIGATPGHDSWMALQTLMLHGAAVQPTWVIIATLWSDVVYQRGPHMSFSSLQEGALSLRGVLDSLALYRLVRRALQPWLRSSRVLWAASNDDIGPDPRGTLSRVPLAAYIRNLRALVAHTRSLKARPVLLLLPAPMDFDSMPPLETVQVYRDAMRRVAAEQRVILVDGPDYFRKNGGTAGHFLDNVHPGPAGHALLGQALAEAMAAAR